MVSASYGIRAAKSSFNAVDPRLERLALTLGCTHGRAMRMVALPMARNGLAAGAVMAWARAVGVFGPLMVFAGAVRMKTEVLPTTIYLELTVGRIEPALAVAMLMLAIAMVALTLIHWLGQTNRWWGP
jgi:molybdate transport system permease protein